MRTGFAALAAGLLWASGAVAASQLAPASPQPGGLRPGLSVTYAYPETDIRTLSDARKALSAGAKGGNPLSGLDYRDTNEGDATLTSDRALNVAARITGFVRFDAAGSYEIEFLTNDGIDAKIGGQPVGYFDGRQTCDTTRVAEVEVPEAGWYPVDILYFQRLGTACLHMRWGPAGGKRSWTPDSAFGRK